MYHGTGKGFIGFRLSHSIVLAKESIQYTRRKKKTSELEIHFLHDTPIRAKQLCGRRMLVGSAPVLFDGSLYHFKVRNTACHKTARSPGLTLGMFLYAQALPSFSHGIYQDGIDIPSRQTGWRQ